MDVANRGVRLKQLTSDGNFIPSVFSLNRIKHREETFMSVSSWDDRLGSFVTYR